MSETLLRLGVAKFRFNGPGLLVTLGPGDSLAALGTMVATSEYLTVDVE
jgi:hypothetical protein